MSDRVTDEITAIVSAAGAAESIEVVDVELRGAGASRLLRVFIDKPGGVTHGDCETISRELSAALDERDVIPDGPYHLEVSSPGVERKLSKPRDFERFAGQKVKIVLREPVDGHKTWEGTLSGFKDGIVSIATSGAATGAATGKDVSFGIDQVSKANLKFEW